ncbi:amidohydrolase family protein [Yersinia intermedia]|uniref:amidohydrolase family protein n=1 Tax=Yersinia intermedia TaxID=631 RepID=UPI000B720995|nr:amidohydrolase family protein [Yersinia intermedia]MCW8113870.1 amidohydrolase family protein [Yersinia intermedia]MDA5482973.1 amidohydrolase family protein [Yersinia intermedia]MDA5518681.1 amidohydrolase family protein [Yersinia intermedia]OWF90368.1 hypothetical protein B4916_16115 [Yersinia intermedia]
MKYIDSHVHLWDPNVLSYTWLAELPALNRPLLPHHLVGLVDKIAGAIVVQADCQPEQGLDEVRWINHLVDDASPIPLLGIVAWAPLEQGQGVENYLQQLVSQQRVVGVRRSLQNEPDRLLYDEQYRMGVLCAARQGLSIDMCVRQHQLPALHDLLLWLYKRCPDARVVLDHMGKPAVLKDDITSWSRDLAALACFPELYCKLSGLPTEADWQYWQDDQLLRYLHSALDLFGARRCMFGGDWPVVELAGGYRRWKHCVTTALSQLTPEEQQAVWYGTAYQAYSLDKGTSSIH